MIHSRHSLPGALMAGDHRRNLFLRLFGTVALLLIGVTALTFASASKSYQQSPLDSDTAILEAARHVEVASVSDAIEQTLNRKMYMTHRMRPIFASKFAGFAVTVSLKKEPNHDPNALAGMLAAIDQG